MNVKAIKGFWVTASMTFLLESSNEFWYNIHAKILVNTRVGRIHSNEDGCMKPVFTKFVSFKMIYNIQNNITCAKVETTLETNNNFDLGFITIIGKKIANKKDRNKSKEL